MPLNQALRRFSVRHRPRACHGACDRLRPGRLRASHAVCLRCSTLEPAICALCLVPKLRFGNALVLAT